MKSRNYETIGDHKSDNTLKFKFREEDGSVRIKEDTLQTLDRFAVDVNYTRNELINLLIV